MNNPLEPDRLEDIFFIRNLFKSYLIRCGVKEENLEKVFLILCENLRQGKESKELRQKTIYTLLANEYHQDKIAKLLNASTRTIGRDVKEMADSMNMPRFWKRGLLRDGKLREKNLSIPEIYEKIMENVKNDKTGNYARFLSSVLRGKKPDIAQNNSGTN